MTSTLAALDDIVIAAIGSRFTGAVVRIERAGRVAFERAYGTLDDEPGARTVVPTTRFDLASLTKVVVAHVALDAFARGDVGVSLDAPLTDWFPEWRGTAHAPITARMLLAHTAGMASGADYRTLFAEDVTRFALTRPLVARPGERVIYSDLGFIALGEWLARTYHRSLRAIVREALGRLGVHALDFRSRNDAPHEIPATECDAWRGRVRGSVHDEKAALMGGVAGHAGLFGCAAAIARVAEPYLAAASGRGTSALGALAREAVTEQGADPVLRRGLGWALKTSDENSCGSVASRHTFGHTGFTGTCIWVDPSRDTSVVVLTNAVYYGRRDLRGLRAAICDRAFAAFD